MTMRANEPSEGRYGTMTGVVCPLFCEREPPLTTDDVLKIRVMETVDVGRGRRMSRGFDFDAHAQRLNKPTFHVNPATTTEDDLMANLPPGEYCVDALSRREPVGAVIKNSRRTIIVPEPGDDEDDEEDDAPAAPAYAIGPGGVPVPLVNGVPAAPMMGFGAGGGSDALLKSLIEQQAALSTRANEQVIAAFHGNRDQTAPVVETLRQQIEDMRAEHREALRKRDADLRQAQDDAHEAKRELARRHQDEVDRLRSYYQGEVDKLRTELDEQRRRYQKMSDEDNERAKRHVQLVEGGLGVQLERLQRYCTELEKDLRETRGRADAEVHRLQKENLGLLKQLAEGTVDDEEPRFLEKYGPMIASAGGELLKRFSPPEQAAANPVQAPPPEAYYPPAGVQPGYAPPPPPPAAAAPPEPRPRPFKIRPEPTPPEGDEAADG